MFFRLIICALASTFIVSCADRKREEETAALLDHVEAQLGTLRIQQAELYETADFLEMQGAVLRERSDELALALADIEDAIGRVRVANDLPRESEPTPAPTSVTTAPAPTDEPVSGSKQANVDSPRRNASLGTFLFWAAVIGAGFFFYRRRRARSEEEEAWRTATYAPPTPEDTPTDPYGSPPES